MLQIVRTPKCTVCGQSSELLLDASAVQAWRDGLFVQRAFPDMPADQRELLISGTHPICWDELFGGEGDE